MRGVGQVSPMLRGLGAHACRVLNRELLLCSQRGTLLLPLLCVACEPVCTVPEFLLWPLASRVCAPCHSMTLLARNARSNSGQQTLADSAWRRRGLGRRAAPDVGKIAGAAEFIIGARRLDTVDRPGRSRSTSRPGRTHAIGVGGCAPDGAHEGRRRFTTVLGNGRMRATIAAELGTSHARTLIRLVWRQLLLPLLLIRLEPRPAALSRKHRRWTAT